MIFWRLFASYFLLILIPVIAAIILAHVLVIRIIEQDAERINMGMMNRFSEQADDSLQSLKTNMINMLSISNLRSLLLASSSASEGNERRAELMHSLRDQLQKLESEPLVKKAYYYFVHEDLIIDAETYTDKSYYYTFRYPLDLNTRTELSSTLMGKKMMDIASSPAGMTAIMSYPFNTPDPDVYLLVDVHPDKLQELILISEDWVTGTAIIDQAGRFISQTGIPEQHQQALLKRAQEGALASPPFRMTDETGLSLTQSSFDETWYYVSMIDLGTLMKPVAVTRAISWLFLAFFVLVGGVASYYVSRRWYRPIAEIKEGLESHQLPETEQSVEKDEFAVIKLRSQLIMSENKELFQMVNGMRPVIQEQFVAKILLGQYRDSLSIMYYAKEIGFNYSSRAARTVYCIAFHYDPAVYDPLSESSKMFIHAELKESIHRLAPALVWLCQLKPDMLVSIVQHVPVESFASDHTAEQLKGLLLNYSSYYKATIGVGGTVHSVEELHQSYSQAAAALKQRGLHSTVEICKKEQRPEQQWDCFLSVKDVHVILNQYKAREYEQLLQFVMKLIEEGKRRDATAVQMKYLCADVLNTWIRAVESEHNELNVPYYSTLFERINRCMTWEELARCFEEIHRFLFRRTETSSRSQQFRSIVSYIDEHYDRELSIEYFAGLTSMSIGHFSRTFKEEVGEKFVEYIAKRRLEQAKHLLLETDMKMDEIAERVGYWGRNSLIRAFRKYEGITPAKYRALYQ